MRDPVRRRWGAQRVAFPSSVHQAAATLGEIPCRRMAARQIELFYLGADPVPAGALVTSREENTYRCRISFSTPDGTTIDNDAAIATGRSMRDWTAFSFSDGGQVIHGAR